MKNKHRTGLIISGFALFVVTGFCVLTTFGTVQWIKSQGAGFALFSNDTVKAEANETIAIDPGDLEKVILNLSNGDVTILPAEGEEITLELTKTSWGSSSEQAEARLETLSLEQKINGKILNLTFDSEPEQYAFSFGTNIPPRMDVVMYLPDGFETEVRTMNGDVAVQTYQGELTISNSFGNVNIEGLTGKLEIGNTSGSLTLEDIDARGHDVHLINNFGEIHIQDFRAMALTIEGSSSNLVVDNLQVTGECSFTNRFALTEVSNFSCGSISLESNGAYINLENGNITDDLTIKYDFASLVLTEVIASSYDLETNNGSLTSDFMQGEVTIVSNFGNVDIRNAEVVTLDIQTQAGNVSFSGSLNPDAAQTIATTMGEVSLTIPAESAYDLHLESNFGTIITDFRVTLVGQINPQNLEGMINGGGPLLTITTNSANIYLNVLDPGDE